MVIGWSWYVGRIKQKTQVKYWEFWFPAIIGLGMSSFLFSPIYSVLSYLLPLLALSVIIFKKGVWLSRWKEGFLSYLAIFSLFLLLQFVFRGFSIDGYLGIKTFSTFVVGLFLIIFLIANWDKGKLIMD